ncbi:MAG TPA: LacI family DNA-binding transcriptional regulator [Nocardioidaceae bacterium]|nr:LacI family DNA-binding transcriptional regulator [Nocardioidaceae bacterium]
MSRGSTNGLRHNGHAPTLATVAREAGVSRQTVSNALNSPHLLRPETLERVRRAIDSLGYSPNRAARNLRTRASHLIGLRVDRVVEGTANATMDRFLHSLVESSKDAGYHVLLFSSGVDAGNGAHDGRPDETTAIAAYDDLLRSTAVDAFVITDTYRGNPQAGWLDQRGAPFVAFGRPWDEPKAGHPWVDVDGRTGVMLAVDHLVERGHERIAWVGWQKSSFIGEDRRTGWSDAMHGHGLSTSRLSARGDDTLDFGRRAAHALLEAERPTAFVCVSDTVAMGVLHTLAELGLAPGRDIAVVGFDDSIAAQVAPPGLTSVRQPLEQVAVEIVALLDKRLSHKPIDEPGRLLTPTLSVRGSS